MLFKIYRMWYTNMSPKGLILGVSSKLCYAINFKRMVTRLCSHPFEVLEYDVVRIYSSVSPVIGSKVRRAFCSFLRWFALRIAS